MNIKWSFNYELLGKRANKARKIARELIKKGSDENDKINKSKVRPK